MSSSLRQIVERIGPLDCKRAARYVQDVAQQLAEMERLGQPLGDVRPGTIFLDETGTARLAATDIDITASISNIADVEVAEIADCLAPERAINNRPVDRRADIYSLGCVFYFLLTSRLPFGEGSISERLLKHQTAAPNAINDIRTNVPKSLVDICDRMIQKRPRDRFGAAGEVVDAIEKWRREPDNRGE